MLYSRGSHLYLDRTSNLAEADDRLARAGRRGGEQRCCDPLPWTGRDAGGEEGDTGNEYSSGDKRDLNLPPCQQKLLRAVLAAGKPTVVVLSAGNALAVEEGNAILQAWYPGELGGAALAHPVWRGFTQRPFAGYLLSRRKRICRTLKTTPWRTVPTGITTASHSIRLDTAWAIPALLIPTPTTRTER